MNKKTLSLKMNKSFGPATDAPSTPIDQTLCTPVDPPNDGNYFSAPPINASHASFYSHHNESDDILTDTDEPQFLGNRTMKNYSVSFTPLFDQLVMGVYAHILLLPTTTPFLGVVPPLGLVSRVANETMLSIMKTTESGAVYDLQCVLNLDCLRNHTYQPVILQLIRKRLLDLCALQRLNAQHQSVPPTTSVLVAVSGPTSNWNLVAPKQQSQGLGMYSGLGLRQLSISNLLLNELNINNYNQAQTSQAAQVAQAAALTGSRLRSSSLNLRKHSLTRNNSYSGSNWLHVGNMQNVRPSNGAALGMNADYGASTDSLQLMHDFVPQAFISRLGNSLANLTQAGNTAAAPGGFNSMMLDYQTPPSSAKSSFSLGGTPPSSGNCGNTQQTPSSAGNGLDYDDFDNFLMRSRSSSRGTSTNFPRPLTINTDTGNFLQNMNNSTAHANTNGYGGALGETLNSPFLSATTPSEEFGHFMGHGASNSAGSASSYGSTLPVMSGLRNGPLITESPVKDVPMANGNNKINLPGQFSLSEKKRDSLKLKRGIH